MRSNQIQWSRNRIRCWWKWQWDQVARGYRWQNWMVARTHARNVNFCFLTNVCFNVFEIRTIDREQISVSDRFDTKNTYTSTLRTCTWQIVSDQFDSNCKPELQAATSPTIAKPTATTFVSEYLTRSLRDKIAWQA